MIATPVALRRAPLGASFAFREPLGDIKARRRGDAVLRRAPSFHIRARQSNSNFVASAWRCRRCARTSRAGRRKNSAPMISRFAQCLR